MGKLYGDFGGSSWDAELVRRRGLAGWQPPRAAELLPAALGCLNPVSVFEAVRELLDRGRLIPGELRIEFVGSYGAGNARLARELGLDRVVSFRSTVDAGTARRLIQDADALLLISSGGEHVVPAKSYEYLAAAKPLLVIAPPGDVPDLLSAAGVTWFGAGLDDPASTRLALEALLEFLRAGLPARPARPEVLARYERRRQTGELAHIFDAAAGRMISDFGFRISDLGSQKAGAVSIPKPEIRNPKSEIRKGAS